MDIRDVVHGVITVEDYELPVLDSYPFQRLRQIKQTGFAEQSYPGASHSRYIHSLGAMHTATLAWESILRAQPKLLRTEAAQKFKAIVRLAALLHDVGHGPLSHTTEFAMPEVSTLKIPSPPGGRKPANRKATHEDYTIKIILDSDLTPQIEKIGRRFGFTAQHVAALVEPEYKPKDGFFNEQVSDGQVAGSAVSFFPILHQLISSEMDADRMDYLRRDSFHAGVSYGVFDAAWLISNFRGLIKNNECFLGIEHRALYAFEDFLLSRYHMFLMVYLHHKTVIYDEMLGQYLSMPNCPYRLPSDINEYYQCTDSHLYSHLQSSSNIWAKRIIARDSFRVLLETHSGIPGGDKAREKQDKLFHKVVDELRAKKIPYIATTSKGELSKYFGKDEFPIYVRYDNQYSTPELIPLQKCTELFKTYPSVRTISRIYVASEDLKKIRTFGRAERIAFEEE